MTQYPDFTPNPTFINGFNRALRNLGGDAGDFLEFGVYGGRTFAWLAEQLLSRSPKSILRGFDSWQGIPKETEGLFCPPRHAEGMMSLGKIYVIERLENLGIRVGVDKRFRFVDGFFCDSLTQKVQKNIKNLAFVNIDVDIHKSTVELLDFITPLVHAGTVLFFDDWKDPDDAKICNEKWGEHLAFEQWLEKNPNIVSAEYDINFLNQRWIEILKV